MELRIPLIFRNFAELLKNTFMHGLLNLVAQASSTCSVIDLVTHTTGSRRDASADDGTDPSVRRYPLHGAQGCRGGGESAAALVRRA